MTVIWLKELILANVWQENIWPLISEDEQLPGMEERGWTIKESINKEDKNGAMRNNIFKIPEEINRLVNLEKFICGGGGLFLSDKGNLVEIPNLDSLTKLEILDLGNNKIQNVSSLRNLENLRRLYLSGNEIQYFDLHLKNLKCLYINTNKLTEFTISNNLPKLEFLGINNNRLKRIYVNGYSNIKYLDISHSENSFDNSDLDFTFLNKLSKLRFLAITNIKIKNIDFLKKNSQLQFLDIKNNLIRYFPLEILNYWPVMNKIFLYGNPIENIPKELFDKVGTNALGTLKSYAASLLYGSQMNNEVKLIVVGNTTAGKTSLLKLLQEDKLEIDQNSTHGISLTRWPILNPDLSVNSWDFGGQEYYHATHRLFLSDRALYLIVWEADTDEEKIIETDIFLNGKRFQILLEHFSYSYWIESVRYYAPESTILIVQNKIDKSGIKPVSDECFEGYLKVQPPAFYLSAIKADEGQNTSNSPYYTAFCAFKVQLIEHLRKSAGNYNLGLGWVLIRETIRQLGEDKPWMTFDEFRNLCQITLAEAIPYIPFNPDTEMPGLLVYLTEAASAIIHYADDAHLRDIVFLNPQWVTDTIYDILSYDIRDREVNKGEFTRAEVEAVLDGKGIGGLTDTFLDLMKKDRFELIFDKPNCSGEYIAPQYLPDTFHDPKVLEQLRPESPISFILHYPRFMPKSIFMRFMVRYGDLVRDAYWKYGIVLGKPSQRAIAECQFSERKIIVQLAGGSEAKNRARDYFETLWKLSAEKPEVEVSVNGTDFVPIGDLMDSLNQVPKVKSKQGNWVTVDDFYYLFGKESNLKREESLKATIIEPSTPEIFFSYAWGDEHEVGESRETIVNELYESLKMDGYQVVRDKMDLGYKGLISGFIDRIGKGNIVIVVISDKYLKSPYCMFELLEIYRNARFEKGEFANAIFPVRVESLALNDPEVVDSYYEYWEDKEKKWHDLISKRRVNTAQTDTYHKVRKINNEFGDLIGHVSDMNTLTKELLSKDNFAEIKKAIKARIESLE